MREGQQVSPLPMHPLPRILCVLLAAPTAAQSPASTQGDVLAHLSSRFT